MPAIDEKIRELEAQIELLKSLQKKSEERSALPSPFLPIEYPLPLKNMCKHCLANPDTVIGGVLDIKEGKEGFLLAIRQMLDIIESYKDGTNDGGSSELLC